MTGASLPPPALPAAGWYPDPDGDATRIRWWDGWRWTGHYHRLAPEPPKRPRSLRALAVCAIVAIAAVTLVEAWSAAGHLNYRNATGELISGAESTRVQGAIEWLRDSERYRLIAYLAAAVAFLAWFHRAYVNVTRRGIAMRFSSGWAVGAWFVPLLNLVRPKHIADDIDRGTRALATGVDPGHVTVAPLVHLWWAAWVIGAIAGTVAGIMIGDANADYLRGREDFVDAIQREQAGVVIAAIAAGVMIVAGVLAILFVVRVTGAQRDATESPASLTSPPLPAPRSASVGPPA